MSEGTKTLLRLEVSRKQEYIFSHRQLRENRTRSLEIDYVTSEAFFREAAPELYAEENLVFCGGGQAVLRFASKERTAAFARAVTAAALRRFPDMELFACSAPIDDALSPGENLRRLNEAAERKKSLRRGSFRRGSFGVERLDEMTFRPVRSPEPERPRLEDALAPPEGWEYPSDFEKLCGKDNFIAVVHIDGNAMGNRVRRLYDKSSALGWEDFCRAAQAFSRETDAAFKAAFLETAQELSGQRALLENLETAPGVLPLRPVILAGDDVCFVSAGSAALSCAEVFLRRLAGRVNPQDDLPYAACAGAVLVHRKHPFHRAYSLSKELCENAKRFGASIDPAGGVSAMDWHIEFGQLNDDLTALRRDYTTLDSTLDTTRLDEERLELRPVAVLPGENVSGDKGPDGLRQHYERETGGVRTWAFFRALCLAMQGEYGKTARSKIKDLRAAFRQGHVESEYFLRQKEIGDFLYHAYNAKFGARAVEQAFEDLRRGDKRLALEAFRAFPAEGGKTISRCLFFDAIEMIDHCLFFEEVKE